MKPFDTTFWTITGNHISVRNVLAVAISFFYLIAHVLYFLYLSAHESRPVLLVLFAHLTKSLYILLLNASLFNPIKTVWIFQSL